MNSTENHNDDPQPVYFGAKANLFGWLHRPTEQQFASPVVICNPVGFEYVRAHKSLRQLADRLAAAGFVVVRFDYEGCGDSAGSDRDPSRVRAWLESIAAAAELARDVSGAEQVNLLGLRLGGTLAWQSLESLPVENLVLWNPCVSGGIYVRDMQIIAHASEKSSKCDVDRPEDIAVDAAGFVMTRETTADLGQLKMSATEPASTPNVLLIERDDVPGGRAVQKCLDDHGVDADVVQESSYKAMMLAPQRSRIPETTLETVTSWLQSHSAHSGSAELAVGPSASTLIREGDTEVSEAAHWFGAKQELFGIVTSPRKTLADDRPAIVLLCGGSVHHVSANRMYVPLARQLAGMGYVVLRMDIAGIGESVSREAGAMNNPYHANLADDVQAAMDLLKTQYGARRFELAGLCSGAYAALKVAEADKAVVGLTLINQLVYFLPEGNTEIYTGDLAGGADYPRTTTFFDRAARKVLRYTSKFVHWPSGLLTRRSLGGNIDSIWRDFAGRNVRLSFLFSRKDPAADALLLYSGKTVHKLCKGDAATLRFFAGADHTFSSIQSQSALLQHIGKQFELRWQSANATPPPTSSEHD